MKYDLLDFRPLSATTRSAPPEHLRQQGLNPNVRIYLYVDATHIYNDQDSVPQVFSTRSAAMTFRAPPHGSLNGDHPELFCSIPGKSHLQHLVSNPAGGKFDYLMDFGSAVYQSTG